MKMNDNSQILSIISKNQMNWLKKVLLLSKAKVKFIVTTTVFSDIVTIPRLSFDGIVTKSEKTTFNDLYNLLVNKKEIYGPLISLGDKFPKAIDDYELLSIEQKYRVFGCAMSLLDCGNWMYYDINNTIKYIPQSNKDRNEIISFIKNNKITGVIFLSGDLHTSFISYCDDLLLPNTFPLLEISSSPNASPPSNQITNYMEDNPHQRQFIYATNDKSYSYIETDIENNLVKITYIKKNTNPILVEIDLQAYYNKQYIDKLIPVVKINGQYVL
jgi:phosphodiesterase/alkaline phosphatase D-like protein